MSSDHYRIKIGHDNIYAESGAVAAASGANVTNTITNSLVNRMHQDHGPELASLIQRVGEIVEQSNNKKAADLWERFANQLLDEHPEKPTLHHLWSQLLEVLPPVGQIATAAATFGKLFGG